MRLMTFNKRSLLVILVCLTVSVACTDQRSSYLGYIYFSQDSTIWRLDLANGQETLLSNRHLTEEMSISPDGRRLSYAVLGEIRRGSPRSIWVMDTHTGQEIEISHNVPFVETFWLPDSRLAVLEYPDWHISSDGTTLAKGEVHPLIAEPRTGQTTPASWSVVPPDSGRSLYAPTFDCAAEMTFDHQSWDTLRVVCLDVSEPITIATPLSLGDVAWSSDGSSLAFNAGEEVSTWDSWRLYIWRRETNVLREIGLGTRNAVGLSWSPDGQWIAFHSGGNDLCVVEVENGDVTCFEDYVSAVGIKPAWSPDSQAIVLSSNRIGQLLMGETDLVWDLFIIGIPKGNAVRITDSPEMESRPVWGH